MRDVQISLWLMSNGITVQELEETNGNLICFSRDSILCKLCHTMLDAKLSY